MDSSPDLSLKLRRESNGSKDSFYMDFAQGIDADIDDIIKTTSTIAQTAHRDASENRVSIASAIAVTIEKTIEQPKSPTLAIPEASISGDNRTSSDAEGTDPTDTLTKSPSTVIMSPGILSQQSALVKKKITYSQKDSLGEDVIDKDSGARMTPSCSQHVSLSSLIRTQSGLTQPGPLAVTSLDFYRAGFQSHLPNVRRPSRMERQAAEWRHMGSDALTTTLSALYGKLLVVLGTAFPMAEVISTYIPPSYYEWYYLYLYVGSMLFLFYMSLLLLTSSKSKKEPPNKFGNSDSSSSSISECGRDSGPSSHKSDSLSTDSISSEQIRYRHGNARRSSYILIQTRQYHYGSFYLRMGAVAFGIGSMIYSGLEVGQYFELERNTKCHNVMLAITPATRMAFIFIQMYFIFLNNEQMKVYKHKTTARFGLMHMIGTNLSVWLSVLIQETKHEILTFYNPENNSLRISHRLGDKTHQVSAHLPTAIIQHEELPKPHHIIARGLKGPHHIYECRRTNIIGSLVQDASPFLFPCTIEYSLICAAILYVMWKNINKIPSHNPPAITKIKTEGITYKKSPHHYSVDCAGAQKGLFVGILILVLTIISLILFFVLISRPEFVNLAVVEVNICELTLYGVSILASLIGMIQIRGLKYDGSRNLELDNILLVGAQTGTFVYSTFTIIGSQFTSGKNTLLVLITAFTSLVQTFFQTLFILDASHRSCVTPDQIRRKPGREIITFLLVTNLAMWAINTLEKSRAESHPIQLHFYGLWAWTIITHVSMPLAIFYRFHSTVCLCEIWKKAYKIKPTYM